MSRDLKSIILVRLQSGECDAFTHSGLGLHQADLPFLHGPIVDGEAFEQAMHRLRRGRLP